MSKQIDLKGNIEKVVRTNGKAGAEVKLMVPADLASKIPLGPVSISIEPIQKSMLDEEEAE